MYPVLTYEPSGLYDCVFRRWIILKSGDDIFYLLQKSHNYFVIKRTQNKDDFNSFHYHTIYALLSDEYTPSVRAEGST